MMVRRIGPEEAELWRQIRLEALAADPGAFGARLSDWETRPLEDFAAQVAANPVFLALDGERPVGSVAWTRDRDGAARAWIESVFVSQAARGKGVGRALIAAAVADAGAAGLPEVWLEVGAANTAARAAYERAGFIAVTGPDRPRHSCGVCEVSMWRRTG